MVKKIAVHKGQGVEDVKVMEGSEGVGKLAMFVSDCIEEWERKGNGC